MRLRFFNSATQRCGWIVLGCAAALVLSGCKPVGPNYKRPAYQAPAAYKETGAPSVAPPPNPANGSWKPANPSDGMLKGNWWEIYHDAELNSLEQRVAANNPALRQALETYLAARDQVAVVRSNLFPSISAAMSGTHFKNSSHRPLVPSNAPTSYNDLLLGGAGELGAGFLGAHSPRRRSSASHSTGQCCRYGERGFVSAGRASYGLLPAPRA